MREAPPDASARPSLWSVRIEDDRGRPATLLDHRFASDAPADLVASIHSVIQSRTQPFRFRDEGAGAWPLLMILLFALQAPIGAGIASLGFSRWTGGVPCLVLIIVVGWLWRRAVRRRLASSIRAACLARAHCASCGYSLEGLATQDDGCTVCPECSAAWRLPAEFTRPSEGGDAPLTSARIPATGMLGRWFAQPAQSILDARGHIVPLVHPDISKHPPAGWAKLDRAQRERIDVAIFGLAFGNRLIALLVAILMVCFGLRQLSRSSSLTMTGFVDALTAAFILAIGLFGMGYAVLRRTISNPQYLADLMLRHNACPSCAAPLEQSVATPRICSTCGSVWSAPFT